MMACVCITGFGFLPETAADLPLCLCSRLISAVVSLLYNPWVKMQSKSKTQIILSNYHDIIQTETSASTDEQTNRQC